MKKMFLLLACASMMASSAMAQMSLVKEVAKAAGSNKIEELQGALEAIQPALNNPESIKDAQTWFVAGKAAFGLFDQMQAHKQLGQEVDAVQMGKVLMDGFNYLQTALPLDSVKETNKDGSFKLDSNGHVKVKTKYSKDINALLSGHINDAYAFAGDCINEQKYAEAAAAYDNFFNLIDKDFAKSAGISLSPEDFAMTKFFQGFAQYYTKDFENSYKNLTAAVAGGYNENNVDLYQASALANVVQNNVDAKDFVAANKFIDEAIAISPNNSVLYDMKGFVVEQEIGTDDALPFYQKAVELDPNNADANYNLGRMYYNQASKIIIDNPDATTSQMIPKLKPIYETALPYLKKAAELDPEKASGAQRLIEDIDYKYEQMGLK
ncbi:MAG: tetratricopeptide repeat protein [Muribaculaceae bacterium]|nr:tetratricopeptide repeat protein [Muribaculaceae bacterium]